MPRIETSQLVSWLRDKAGRAPDLSWLRMMSAAADRLEEYSMIVGCRKVHDYCWANDVVELADVLARLDDSGYELVCVTAGEPDRVMVFFRRPAP